MSGGDAPAEAAMKKAVPSPARRRALAAGIAGTSVEWFDFFLYGTAAALVFDRVFFPALSPGLGTLAAFGSFASGFLARPLGGAVFAHFGDRFGRRPVLVWTLLLTGVATVGIGVLPSYESIGLAAPILLVGLRIVQGIGVGGEWGGAVLMAVESAPAHRRGLYGSGPQVGVPIGVVAGSGSYLLVDLLLTDAQFVTWGWRVPFLAGGVLVGVGLWARLATNETPMFQEVPRRVAARTPVLDVLHEHPRAVLLAAGSFLATNSLSYLQSVWVVSYATTSAGFHTTEVLAAAVVVSLATIPMALGFGLLSDRYGRRPFAVLGMGALALVAVPYILLVDTGMVTMLVLGGLTLQLCGSAVYGPLPATFAALFPTRLRYSGVSAAYQIAAVVGGFAPSISAALVLATGTAIAVGIYLSCLAVVSLGCAVMIGETADVDLRADDGRRPERA